jgi:hypothetical protein
MATVVLSVLVLEVLPGVLRRRWAESAGAATNVRDVDDDSVATPPSL